MSENKTNKAVVILSGGLDSTVCLGLAHKEYDKCIALTFDYSQRHVKEIESAKKIAGHYNAEHIIVHLDASQWGGSSLTDKSLRLPENTWENEIPSTYVPARNIIFLSVALSVAEAKSADAIYIGVNALDYSGYPDCRPEFIEAFKQVAKTGQKRGFEGNPVNIVTPLINLTKEKIVRIGASLNVPLELTWSCYKGGDQPCGTCDSCLLRAKGFKEAGMSDPAMKTQESKVSQ